MLDPKKLREQNRLRTQEVQRALEDIRREAIILEKLHHPNILSYRDYGKYDNIEYIILEYASLYNLRRFIYQFREQKKRIPIERAITILLQIGDAVHTVHKQNIAHCDLKPENILFDEKDDVKLADFGIAIWLDTNAPTSQVRGTYAYMAPEQFDGNVSKLSDQYSLGCVAYELFTGYHPFEGIPPFLPEDRQVMEDRHKNDIPSSIRTLNTDVPEFVEQATMKALAKLPSERHTNVDQYIRSLQLDTPPPTNSNVYATPSPVQNPAKVLLNLQLPNDLYNLLSPTLGELGLAIDNDYAVDRTFYLKRTYSVINSSYTQHSQILIKIPNWILESKDDTTVNAVAAVARMFKPGITVIIFSPSLRVFPSSQIQNILRKVWNEVQQVETVLITEEKIEQFKGLDDLDVRKVWLEEELHLQNLLSGSSTDELELSDKKMLINIIAGLPSVTDVEGNGRRQLLESAGLRKYVARIKFGGAANDFAEEVIDNLYYLRSLGVKPGFTALGMLLLSLLDVTEISDKEKEHIKSIIKSYKLVPSSHFP